jgi:hypothetical protein
MGARRWWRSGFLAVGLAAAAPAAASAQEAPRGLAWGASGILMFWTETQDPFDRLGGPGAQVSYLAPRSLGFEFRASYLVASGFYGLTGVHGEAALTYGIPAGRHLVQVKAGAHGMLAGDSDGSVWGGGGPYGGAGATLRLSGRLGLQLDALGRLFVVSGRAVFAPGGAVALVLLPR